jgi:hypothetical protein
VSADKKGASVKSENASKTKVKAAKKG